MSVSIEDRGDSVSVSIKERSDSMCDILMGIPPGGRAASTWTRRGVYSRQHLGR